MKVKLRLSFREIARSGREPRRYLPQYDSRVKNNSSKETTVMGSISIYDSYVKTQAWSYIFQPPTWKTR